MVIINLVTCFTVNQIFRLSKVKSFKNSKFSRILKCLNLNPYHFIVLYEPHKQTFEPIKRILSKGNQIKPVNCNELNYDL